jgi:hypothetical protein
VRLKLLALTVGVLCLGFGQAQAQQPLKIGFITTLSGPGGYLGQDIRDAFQLAINAEGGKLGGVPVQLVIEDDGLKPGQAKQIAERFMKSESIKLFTGIVFSNVASAVVPDIVDNGGIFVSANAGPSNLAGKECHKNYFVMSWLTDTMQGSAGQNSNSLGYKRAFVLAPNYVAGKDAIEASSASSRVRSSARSIRVSIRLTLRRRWRRSVPPSRTLCSTSIRAVSALRLCGNTSKRVFSAPSRWCWPSRRWITRCSR